MRAAGWQVVVEVGGDAGSNTNALVSVQNEFGLYDRRAEKPCPSASGRPVPKSNKAGLLQLCKDKGLVFLPYGALGGLKSRRKVRDLAADFPELAVLAQRKGVSAHALALAWMRAKWPHCVIPLVGTRCTANVPNPSEVDGHAQRLTAAEVNAIGRLKKRRGCR